MSEEEKFIIRILEGSINTYIEKTKVTKVQLTTKEAEILINLIDRLQKELEQEKQKSKYYEKELDLTTVYMSGFYDGEKKWKDKITNEIKELGNMKVGGEVFITSVNFAKKILENLLKEN